MKTALVAALLCLNAGALSAWAQTLETSGGGGTLFNGEGGEMKLYLPNGAVSGISGGIVQGHVVYGFNTVFPVHGAEISLGDEQILFPLPTDFSTGNYGFYVRGGALRKKTPAQELTVFGGWISTQYLMPTFMGLKPTTPTGLIFYKAHFGPHWTFESHEVFDSRQTAIQSLIWAPARQLKLAASGGTGSNSPYAAGALDLDTRRLIFHGSYASESAEFRRIQSPLYVVVENNHGNGHADLNPFHHFHVTGDHINLLTPLANGKSAEAEEDDAGGSESIKTFHASANAFWAKSQNLASPSSGIHSRGQSYAAGISLFQNWLNVNQAMSTTPLTGRIDSTSILENIRPQWGLAEFVNYSNGSTSFNAGGHYTGNHLGVSVGWSEQFLPFNTAAPFQKVLSVQLSLRLHDS